MKSIARMTQAELAAYVQASLLKSGISVVLSGGAAVSIYTHNQYQSRDLDLVNIHSAARKEIRRAMRAIGFHEQNRYFIHPESRHIVEFPPGPLAIGDELVTHVSRIKYATGTLRVISPTDCVKDRLAAFYFWGDQQSLAQAVLVAKSRRVNMREIGRWARAADKGDQYRVFVHALALKSK